MTHWESMSFSSQPSLRLTFPHRKPFSWSRSHQKTLNIFEPPWSLHHILGIQGILQLCYFLAWQLDWGEGSLIDSGWLVRETTRIIKTRVKQHWFTRIYLSIISISCLSLCGCVACLFYSSLIAMERRYVATVVIIYRNIKKHHLRKYIRKIKKKQ